MMNSTTDQNIHPILQNGPEDIGAVTLARSIMAVESNGNYNAKGKSGESGAYQFMPDTWKSWAGKYLGDQNASLTPENQDMVAYAKIKDLKDQGYTPEQVASIWNSGKPDYTGNVGVNKQGVAFDTPQYVSSVINKFQQLKQGQQTGPTLPNPSQVQPQPQPEQPSVGGFVGNIFSSAGGVIGGLANALFHPIQTVKGLAGIAAGGIEKLIPGQQPDEQKFNQLVDFFKQRYGGIENIKNTLYNDPVGFALDLSTVLGTGGAALGAAGKVADVSKLADVANLSTKVGEMGNLGKFVEASKAATTPNILTQVGGGLSRASELTNPLTYAGKAVGSLTSGIKNVAMGTAGLATGEGATSLKLAEDIAKSGTLEQKTAFNLAMKGQDSPEQILASLEKDQQSLVNQRSAQYKSQLAQIKTGEHSLTTDSVQQIRDNFEQQLQGLEVGRNAQTGELIFDNSILDSDAAAKRIIQQIDKKIEIAQADPTPTNLDNLKKFSGDAYKPQNPLNAVTQSTKQVTKSVLEQNVPQYANMTQKYAQASDLLNEIKDTLGVGGRAKAETVMNKVMSSLNQNRANRLGVLEQFKNADIYKARIAGYKLSQFFPGGLAGRVAEVGGIGSLLHPTAFAAGLLGTSPKLMGLAAKALGTTEGTTARVIDAVSRVTRMSPSAIAMALAQANRTTGGQ